LSSKIIRHGVHNYRPAYHFVQPETIGEEHLIGSARTTQQRRQISRVMRMIAVLWVIVSHRSRKWLARDIARWRGSAALSTLMDVESKHRTCTRIGRRWKSGERSLYKYAVLRLEKPHKTC